MAKVSRPQGLGKAFSASVTDCPANLMETKLSVSYHETYPAKYVLS